MIGTLQYFEEMEIWKEARRLFKKVGRLTNDGPVCSDFRFKSPIRQAAGSIMDNIAEGFERDSRKRETANGKSECRVGE